MRRATMLAGSALVLATMTAAAPAPRWIGAWIAPVIGYEPKIKEGLGRPYENETARQDIRVVTTGSDMRVRLSNELGDTALNVGAASVARLAEDGSVVPGSIRALSFGGAKSVMIPARAPYLSDTIAMPVTAGERLAVSIYYPQSTAAAAHAQMLLVSSGDTTGAVAPETKRLRASGLVSAIEVSGAKPARVAVAFGDSITEGAGATQGKAMSYPEQLGRMLAAAPGGRCWAILNAGISGNRLLHDGRGPNALSRFDRDALAVPGITDLILLEGINDIGKITDPAKLDQAVTADQIIQAYRQLLARAHARGVKVTIATLLPYEGAAYADAEGEARRAKVNGWIRANARQFDGLIDFDTAMGEPGKPTVMRLAEQIGDHLHPNDAGYTRMAKTALAQLLKRPC